MPRKLKTVTQHFTIYWLIDCIAYFVASIAGAAAASGASSSLHHGVTFQVDLQTYMDFVSDVPERYGFVNMVTESELKSSAEPQVKKEDVSQD